MATEQSISRDASNENFRPGSAPGSDISEGSRELKDLGACEYTMDQLDELEYRSEARATIKHLMFAIEYLSAELDAAGIVYGLMGGFSMIIRGHNRTTKDIDIALDSDPRKILAFCRGKQRIARPPPLMVSGAGLARIFVKVGGSTAESVTSLWVMADLIFSRERGRPDDLAAHVGKLSETEGYVQQETSFMPLDNNRYNHVDLYTITRMKLHAFNTRGEGEDELGRDGPVERVRAHGRDYRDLSWLCLHQQYGPRIRAFASQLDVQERVNFVNFFGSENAETPAANRIATVLGVSNNDEAGGSATP